MSPTRSSPFQIVEPIDTLPFSHFFFRPCTIMKAPVFAALVASAAAFAPAQLSGRASTAVHADFSKEIGALPPLGFIDPLNLLQGDQKLFDAYRTVELKHGRVAMMAFLGYITTLAGFRLPGYEDVPCGLKALTDMPASAWLYTGFSVAILEIVMRDATGESQFVGDFRNGFDFGWDSFDEATKAKKRTIELNNG